MSSPLVREYCPGCAAATFYVIHEGEPHRYCNGCSAADRRARSTLQLLSRFAVFWAMELMARWVYSDHGYSNTKDRTMALKWAIERGLLRVTWMQP